MIIPGRMIVNSLHVLLISESSIETKIIRKLCCLSNHHGCHSLQIKPVSLATALVTTFSTDRNTVANSPMREMLKKQKYLGISNQRLFYYTFYNSHTCMTCIKSTG